MIFSHATIEYARKLVGLDAGDEFSAEYLDGDEWIAIEALRFGSRALNHRTVVAQI